MNLSAEKVTIFTFEQEDELFAQKYEGVDNIKDCSGTVFPQMIRGLLETEATSVNQKMKIAAAEKFATVIRELPENIDYKMKAGLADAIARSAIESGVAKK